MSADAPEMQFLSATAILRNEAPFIREWLDFHLAVGVERFHLYDLGSTDRPIDQFADLVSKGVVSYQEAPEGFTHRERQISSYNHSLLINGRNTEWMAFIDVDEFLFSPTGKPVPLILRSISGAQAVFVNWVIFGSSAFARPPKTVVENLVRRARSIEAPLASILEHERICDKNDARITGEPINGKSIVRPSVIRKMRVHRPDPAYMEMLLNENGERVYDESHRILSPAPSYSLLRLNHYWMRYTDSPKSGEGRDSWPGLPANCVQAASEWDSYCNSIEDKSILEAMRLLTERG